MADTLHVFSSSGGLNSAGTISSEATTESMCSGGDFGQDHSERMPWDYGQLMLPLSTHLLSCYSGPGVEVFETCRILLIIQVKADFSIQVCLSLNKTILELFERQGQQ